MQFQITTEGQRVNGGWGWEKVRDLDLDLYHPRSDEHLSFLRKFMLKKGGSDWEGIARYVAAQWFRDFKGAVDPQGNPLPNTEEVRYLMLVDPTVGLLFDVLTVLRGSAEKDEEGKDDAASD